MSLAWGGHSNGRIPASALMPVPWAPHHLLEPTACLALVALNVAYRIRFGVNVVLTDSYRAYSGNPYAQVETFLARYQPRATGSGPFGDVRRWNGTRYVRVSAKGSAAVPGTSNHGWARAVDLGGGVNSFTSEQHRWMREHAPEAGWVHPTWAHDNIPGNGSQEPWHWERPTLTLVTKPVAGAPSLGFTPPAGGGLPDPLTPEDDMFDDSARALLMEVRQIAANGAAAAEQSMNAARSCLAVATEARGHAARSAQLAADAVALARDAAEMATLGRDEGDDQTRHLLSRLGDLQERLPRVSRARYDRPGAGTYAELAQVAQAQGLTYSTMSGLADGITATAQVDTTEVARALAAVVPTSGTWTTGGARVA